MVSDSKNAEDMLAFGKQFWDTWAGFAQGAGPGSTPSWGSPFEVFSKAGTSLPDDARQAIEALGEHGKQFLQFMQTAAAQMGAGNSLGATDVADLWRRSVADGNPMLDAWRATGSEAASFLEKGSRDLQAMLAPFKTEWNGLLRQPAFGLAREKQEAMQELLAAAQEHAEANSAYTALLAKSSQRGMEYFEDKLAERSEPGRQIDSARALYDVWIDAAEEAYAEVAMSPQFRTVYANLVNSQMRLKRALRQQVEQQAAEFGLPTRSELDGTHQKIKALRRESRELRARIADLEAAVAGSNRPASPAAAASSSRSASKTAGKPASTSRAPSRSGSATARKAGKKPAAKVVDLTEVSAADKPRAKSKSAQKSARKKKGN